MATPPNRAAIIAKTADVLAKHYEPVKPTERPVLEQMLYAACLEDARPAAADEAFARLQESFFDWNEVRVTTIGELAEVLRGLPKPQDAAANIKYILHSVFESRYDFDLEPLKKLNLGAAIKELQQLRGSTRFIVSYVVQTTLGGHSIPLGNGSLQAMYIVGAASETEIQKGTVPGLERAISKNQGIAFGSLLNQLGADLTASPFGVNVRKILQEIAPDAKQRLPKRGVKATDETEPPRRAGTTKGSAGAKPKASPTKGVSKKTTSQKAPSPADQGSRQTKATASKSHQKSAAQGKAAAAPPPKKRTDSGSGLAKKATPKKAPSPAKSPPAKKATAKKSTPKKTAGTKPAAKKRAAKSTPKKGPLAKKSPVKKSNTKASGPIAKKAGKASAKSTSKQLARRKPR